MRAALLLLPVLAEACSPADAGAPPTHRVYDLHGGVPAPYPDMPSCGAGWRLARDSYVLREYDEDPGYITVNMTQWRLAYGAIPGEAVISHWADPTAYTWVMMELDADDGSAAGTVTLFGNRPDRVPCSDRATIYGIRIH